MSLETIKKYFLQSLNRKSIIIGVVALVIIGIGIFMKKSDTFLFVKVPSNKTVKIEINDLQDACDGVGKEDSLLLKSFLDDKPYVPKKIVYIAWHVTDGLPPKKNSTKQYWENFFYTQKYPGAKMVGYNYLVSYDKIIALRPVNKNNTLEKNEIVWGVANKNSITISIAYEGGRIWKNGKWITGLDTRSDRQKFLMDSITTEIKKYAPEAMVIGHNQFPGVKKTCPNFKVK